MAAAREKDQADFDLERFIDMFDEAINSRDERVINALRSLMMMVVLTRPESREGGLRDRHAGPLRRLYEDVHNLHRRIERIEDQQQEAGRRVVQTYDEDLRWQNKQKEDYLAKMSVAPNSLLPESVRKQIKTSL
jgi:hypothetical protein